MRNSASHKGQKAMLRRMLPFAIPLLIYYLGDNFFGYITLFQQLHGFSTQTIGKVGGIACIMVIFGEMVLGRLSDALRSVKLAAILGLLLTGACSILLPISANWYIGGFAVVLAVIIARDTIITPANTMLENWILRSSYHERFDYGLTKSIGAAGAVLGSVIASAIMTILCAKMEQVRAVHIVFIIGSCMIFATVLSMLSLKDAPPAPKENVNKKSLNPLRMMKNFEYLALSVMYCFLCVSVNPTNAFLSVLMTENHLDVTKLSLILGLQAVFQFPVLIFFSKLSNRLPMRPLIVIGVLFYATASILRSYATNIWILALGTAFFGMGGSLMISAAYNYIFQLVPTELRASGQAYFICFGSLGSAFGVTAGGYAIAAWGVQRFYRTFGLATAAIGMIYLIVTEIRRNTVSGKETSTGI